MASGLCPALSSFLGGMVCLSLLRNSGTMVSKGWGVLPRFFRVKPVTLGFESDQTSLLTAVLNPSTGKAAMGDDEHQTNLNIKTVTRSTASASWPNRWELAVSVAVIDLQ